MGLFSFVGGLFGAGAQKKASQQATDAQVTALNRGIDAQNAFNTQTREDYLPYTQAGTQALSQLTNLQGLNGDAARAQAFNLVTSDPRYASLFSTGQDTILANASATGGVRGGDTQALLGELGPDVLARVYDMVSSGLGSTAGLGLGAQNTVTGVGQGVTNANTGLFGNIGGAQANNYLAKGRINAQNWANAGSFLDEIAGAATKNGGFSLQSALKSIF